MLAKITVSITLMDVKLVLDQDRSIFEPFETDIAGGLFENGGIIEGCHFEVTMKFKNVIFECFVTFEKLSLLRFTFKKNLLDSLTIMNGS